jgi:hypothetical protein
MNDRSCVLHPNLCYTAQIVVVRSDGRLTLSKAQ